MSASKPYSQLLNEYLQEKRWQTRAVMTSKKSDPVQGMTKYTFWEAHWTFDGVERASASQLRKETDATNAAAEKALIWLSANENSL
ncbi:hypothetical protein PIIN_08035 [Serendipita indica DSM 11827]|uniref:DRBM domain-containing protein n=1 Tax=Serendipita indica (strain DSM 11827) TaxID=1109443 RepID=G4TRY8_SERID|nr:hypothetical protein PIIN_08035 [Serendipita indica DSM 11827]